MKTTYEATERETLAFVDLAKYMIDALVRMQLASPPPADFADEDTDEDFRGNVDGADHFVPEDDVRVDEAPAAPAAPPEAPVDLQTAYAAELLAGYASDKNARVVMPSALKPLPANHPLVIAGRKAYFAFFDVWQRNFGVEDTEQPDRATLMRDTAAANAGPILAYLRFRGGLVAGAMEFFADSAGQVSPADQKRAVEIATNIAQVGSVLAPEFTDMMEFVKPDGTVIPHVRYEQVRIPQE